MWRLTGFADEAAPEPADQIALLQRLGLSHVELRSAWFTKVLDLDSTQLANLQAQFQDGGISLSMLGTDLGKIPIQADFGPHLDRTKRAMEVADQFGTDRIRTFSFFLPPGEDPAQFRHQVLDRLSAMVEIAGDANKTLMHENEKEIYGDVPSRVTELAEALDPRHFELIFDPANYVQCGVSPMDAYPLARTTYIHIKDARADDHSVVPAGEGDGQIPQLLEALDRDGYDGFFSIEPHLGDFDAFGGLCGPELWEKAFRSFVELLGDRPWA